MLRLLYLSPDMSKYLDNYLPLCTTQEKFLNKYAEQELGIQYFTDWGPPEDATLRSVTTSDTPLAGQGQNDVHVVG